MIEGWSFMPSNMVIFMSLLSFVTLLFVFFHLQLQLSLSDIFWSPDGYTFLWHCHLSIARRFIETISIPNQPRLCTTNVNRSNEKKWFHSKKKRNKCWSSSHVDSMNSLSFGRSSGWHPVSVHWWISCRNYYWCRQWRCLKYQCWPTSKILHLSSLCGQ